MANEPLKFEYRIPRVLGYLLAGGSLLLASTAVGLAWSNPFSLSRWGWVTQSVNVLICTPGAFLLARWSIRALLANTKEPTCVQLTADTLKVPRLSSFGPITETIVPLNQVTKMRYSRVGNAQSLYVWHAGRGTGISGEFLAGAEEFQALQAALTERLQTRDVPIEEREFRFSRPQFSLRFLLLATTLVSVGLGLIAWAGIPFQWSMLVAFGIWLVCQIGIVGLLFGNGWLRAFLAGAFAGILGEVAAIILTSPVGPFAALAVDGIGPVYPFTALLSGPPTSYDHTRMVWATVGGPLLSGLLFGGLTVAVVAVVARRRGRKCKEARAVV